MHLKIVITRGRVAYRFVTVLQFPAVSLRVDQSKKQKKNIKEAISLCLEPEEEIISGKGACVIEVAV